MKPSQHFAVSVSTALVMGFFTRSLYAGGACFLSGFLLDIDHVIEYILNFGFKNFSLKNCYEACVQTARRQGELQFKKVYLIFHGYEVALLLLLLTLSTKNVYFFVCTIGYSVHLGLDCIGNDVYPQTYFMVWRIINRFSADKLFLKETRHR